MQYVVIEPRNPTEVKETFEAPRFEHQSSYAFECHNHTLSLIDGHLVSLYNNILVYYKLWLQYILEGNSWNVLDTNLQSKIISKVKSHFGNLFVIASDRSIYYTSTEDDNPEIDFIFKELKFSVKEHEPCVHGIKFDDQRYGLQKFAYFLNFYFSVFLNQLILIVPLEMYILLIWKARYGRILEISR